MRRIQISKDFCRAFALFIAAPHTEGLLVVKTRTMTDKKSMGKEIFFKKTNDLLDGAKKIVIDKESIG